MKWSIVLGRLAGIEIKVHVTFVLILVWVAWRQIAADGSAYAVMMSLVFVLCIFSFVVLHELGHALTARRFGYETQDIVLLPIGGVARFKTLPKEPRQEFLVAIAGPLVNLTLAAIFTIGIAVSGLDAPELEAVGTTWTLSAFIYGLVGVNLMLFLFNLLPAFPMDGGRMLRAGLASRMNYARATRVAASVGQGLALVLAFAGLLISNPMLIFIGLFVWIGAGQEARVATLKEKFSGVRVRDVMLTDLYTLVPGDPLARALDWTMNGSQVNFPVVDNGRLVGMLSQAAMLEAVGRDGADQPVSSAMDEQPKTFEPAEQMQEAFEDLEFLRKGFVAVVENGWLQGLLTRENAAEFLAIRGALEGKEEPIRAGGLKDPTVAGEPPLVHSGSESRSVSNNSVSNSAGNPKRP